MRCKAFQIYARKSQKFELVVDTKKRLVYTVIRLKLGSFRKVCYFAKKQFKRTENFIEFEFCDVVWLCVVKASFRQGAA